MHANLTRGFRACLPIAASVAAYGSVLGVLAAQRGLTPADLVCMNTTIFAGSAQFVMIDMWGETLPLFAMTVAVFAINLRYLLIGASLEPLFRKKSLWRKAWGMHLVADENWAVTMAEQRKGTADVAFLLGGGLCVFLAWNGGTLAGLLGGGFIARPEDYALDFAFTAVFTALALSLFQGRKDILPWLVSAVLALIAAHWLPGKWHVVIGGLGGAITAMLGPDAQRKDGEKRKESTHAPLQ